MRRRVQRCIDKVDPRMSLGECDGELFDGPAIEVLYRRLEVRDGVHYSFHDDAVPEEEQKEKLTELFRMLERKGLPVKYADGDTGANFPCLEIALDEDFHNRFMATIAKGVYEQGEEAMLPIVQRLGLHL
jgi:hypothetical protein